MSGEQPSSSFPAVLATPAGATAFFETLVSFTVYQCEHEHGGAQRPSYKRRKALLTEADRFERGEGWRGENPAAARLMAQRLREHANAIDKRRRGRPRGTARSDAGRLIEAVFQRLADHLPHTPKRRLEDLLFAGGDAGRPGSRGEPSIGQRLFIGALIAELRSGEYSEQEIRRHIAAMRRALDNKRRNRRAR